MEDKDLSLVSYRGEISRVLMYQVVSKLVLFLFMVANKWVTGLLLWNLGRPAFTSGDLPYLMRSWQGWLLILAGFSVLVVYTVLDINVTLLLSRDILNRKKRRIFVVMKEAFAKTKHFKSIYGVIVVLYVSLIAPLAGAVFGITLTQSFVIPEFIMSTINGNFVLRVLYYSVMVIMLILGILHLFTFHYVILNDCDVKTALKEARQFMKKNWKGFFIRYLLFMIKSLLLLAALIIAVYVIPMFVLNQIKSSEYLYHTGTIFFTFLMVVVIGLFGIILLYALMLKLTMIFNRYADTQKVKNEIPKKEKHTVFRLVTSGVLAVMLIISALLATDFDTIFPAIPEANIVAHRCGGTLANENTVKCLEAAIALGVPCAETDVQRTKDNYYIINHDDDFQRCCDDPRTPGEMTLEEIKQLRVKDANDPLAPGEEVATMEELLDAAKDRIYLLIELKGVGADDQMINDVYQMVKERDMIDDVMFISLNYPVVSRAEELHPDVKTGYLCYFSFGDIADMNCDALLLEAETATVDNVDRVHAHGKDVYVWTVNSLNSMISQMAGDIEGLITDEVAQAIEVREELIERKDSIRVLQTMIRYFL